MLDSLGVVRDAVVIDLFAGTGALGIEALSRGADRALFVESAPKAIAAIEANLATLGFADRARVVRSDVMTWLPSAGHVDLALADPPYAFDQWADLLAALEATTVVLESDRSLDVAEPYRLLKTKRYGTTVVHVAQRAGGAS